ncbi:hypothetical protein [Micromonospora sp. KC606]|uniref:hypothetical protein n=1 Tax=Micromonospora sp. KC606 TaxID=2530379 RepID=UPI001A9E726D|nr:hypothetical protein [Micromonospora sp. KC606]
MAGKSFLRIAPWMLVTFALIRMFGSRAVVEPADLDVAVDRSGADARGLVDLDPAVRPFECGVAEAADAAQLGAGNYGRA